MELSSNHLYTRSVVSLSNVLSVYPKHPIAELSSNFLGAPIGFASSKGDGTRLHVGLIAQDVADVFAKHGLDPWKYALLCHDHWRPSMVSMRLMVSAWRGCARCRRATAWASVTTRRLSLRPR